MPKGRERKSYHRINIEDVIEEADFLLGMAPEERLGYCTFTYTPAKQDKHLGNWPVICDKRYF